MIDTVIRAATCSISCGDLSGTGHLITDCRLLTARHCVIPAIESGNAIEVTFFGPEGDISVQADIVAESEEMDACILSVPQPLERQPIPLSLELPREGDDWRSFGYPLGKTVIGHRIAGTISHLLDAPKLRMDIDLTVAPSTALGSYHGLSGSAVVSENASRAMVRLKVDGTLGAISLRQLEGFLAENGIPMPQPATGEPEPHRGLADRTEFQGTFEQMIARNPGDYIFLEGAPGIGKTTFCSTFKPEEPDLFSLGSYSLVSQGRGPGAIFRALPEVFFDWLSTAVSTLITGKPPRKAERSYATLVHETSVLLEAFSKYCESTNRRGLFFIDGVNEAQAAGPGSLEKLLGLLPHPLPKRLSAALTAPNFQNVASSLNGRVKSQNVISLPPLSDEASSVYCCQELVKGRSRPELVARICEKAQGHPLYLRYLIEYANSSPEGGALDDFPVLTGTIEEYYESLWPRLLGDADATNMLAIIARLRWGIRKSDLLMVLTPTEHTVFVPTLSRIRHLLFNSVTTEIYHPSFTDFLISKTTDLEGIVQKRLSEFCVRNSSLDYCALNVVFHLLRSDDDDRSKAVADCNQKWVDTCVEIGIEPDNLIFDIDNALKAAVTFGTTLEVVRLLLLSQRVGFRYNVLFAQSAQLIAEALIAIKQPREALNHVIRFNTLIVFPDEALQIAFKFIQNNHHDEASKLLRLVYQRIIEAYSVARELHGFINLCKLHLRTLFLMRLADGNGRMRQIFRVLDHAQEVFNVVLSEEPPEVREQSFLRVQCVFPSYFLCFRDTYAALADLKEKTGGQTPPGFLLGAIWALLESKETLETYNLPKEIGSLSRVFSDIEELITAGERFDKQLVPAVVDTFIQLGAPSSVVRLVANTGERATPVPLKIRADNGVDLDFDSIHQGAIEWRMHAFLGSDCDCPLVGAFDETGWLLSLDQLIRALFWCEGKARRAKVDANETLRLQALQFLKTRVLHPLEFTLAQRVKWQDSYAIPENLFPFLYERITVLLIDCYPNELIAFLQNLSQRSADQCGLYSEGFREIVGAVLQRLTLREIEPSFFDEIFMLLHRWKENVIRGVENRHELVPEILKLIPLFAKLGATEEAERLYRYMLGVSMGPSWYKEDQLGLMVSVLRKMPPSDDVQEVLPFVAGYLERASGEMTFQRFVRYEKQALIGELFRRCKFVSGCRYFKRQTCGTTAELVSEAQHGVVDKPSPMVGMRYPGGALDEQHAILEMVRNADGLDWRLRWALLEIFQCGDERHLDDYATEYARLINTAGTDLAAISEMVKRTEFVFGAEIDLNERNRFANSFLKELATAHHHAFSKVFVHRSNAESRREPDLPNEKVASIPSTSQDRDSRHDEDLYLPGVFGRQSAIREAEAELSVAERHLKLGNLELAKQHAVKVLRTLQEGGWSIWGNLSEGATRAEDLLREGEVTAADLIRYYAPLLEAERHEAKWGIAEHLITKVTDFLSGKERSQLLQHIVDHVSVMVGDSTDEIGMFRFLTEEPPCNPSVELFRLVLWLLDHPHWLRREKAAGMSAWLIELEPIYLEVAVKEAFSMVTGYSADILCGALDDMSRRQPRQVWDRVFAFLDLEGIFRDCKHVGRLAILRRIAERAANAGATTGAEVASRVLEQFRPGAIELATSDTPFGLPFWAGCISREWESLSLLGVTSKELFSSLEEKMAQLCAPLDVQGGWSLERAVSDSFRDMSNKHFNRWEAKVRFALSTAIFPYASTRNLHEIELALRIFNPSVPERTLTPGFESPAKTVINAILNGKNYAGAIGNSDFYYLNYHEMTERDEGDSWVYIEVLAVVVPASYVRRAFITPSTDTLFTSKELPDFSSVATSHETCYNLKPDFAFFGSFTPAFPLPAFTALIEARESDFFRVNWRNGRSSEMRYFGRPVSEGCLLAVKRTAIRLPAEKKLAWILRMNGEIVAMVDSQNNQLL